MLHIQCMLRCSSSSEDNVETNYLVFAGGKHVCAQVVARFHLPLRRIARFCHSGTELKERVGKNASGKTAYENTVELWAQERLNFRHHKGYKTTRPSS